MSTVAKIAKKLSSHEISTEKPHDVTTSITTFMSLINKWKNIDERRTLTNVKLEKNHPVSKACKVSSQKAILMSP